MHLQFKDLRMPLGSFELSLDAELHGEAIAFFGPSGSGKTSLVDLIAGLRKPAAGRIVLNGVPLTDVAARVLVPPARRGVGYVPQEGALFPHLSVQGNLRYGSKRKGSSALFSLEHVCDVLELQPLLDARPLTLSGGEKQRVALGRALLSQPRLLLLDEPLASLDDQLKGRSLELLDRVRREFQVPMIYVSHSASEVLALCETVLVLEQGKATRIGRAMDVLALHSK